MQLIKSIEIKYLRSVHRIDIKQVGDLTIFSGANDVGKSNILKALNLFFNNQVDWQSPLEFHRDFSFRRLGEVRRESVKGRQFIRIDIEFICPSNYSRSLPPTFTVTKTWYRDRGIPDEGNDLEHQDRLNKLPRSIETARRMLSQFLNRIRFEYVPAIRDRAYFEYVLSNLQETLLATQMQPDDPILSAVRELNDNLRTRAGSLRNDFAQATGIEADVSLPIDPNALFQAFSVSTKWSGQPLDAEEQDISLTLRGDGVQARYVSSLLHYIAENSSLFYIWGFEEPENSVEYNLAIKLASDFEQVYSQKTQIFVTSHSPAFVSLQSDQIVSYRVYRNQESTQVALLFPTDDETVLTELAEDIGLFRIQQELYQQYIAKRQEFADSLREAERLRAELEQITKPVVFVEGKTDVMILNTAWTKLFSGQEMPFVIKNCDPLSQEDSTGGSAGTSTLEKLLSSVPADSERIVIGIFDSDEAGMKTYAKLPRYFEEISEIPAKVSKNAKAAAFLLPVPEGKERYREYKNFSIEFYFDESALAQRTSEGWGLDFTQPKIKTQVEMQGAPILDHKESTLLETRHIVERTKTVFAERIVPTLDTQDFQPFRLVFDQITRVLIHLRPETSPQEIAQPQTTINLSEQENEPSETVLWRPARAYREILADLERFGTITPFLFGRNYYSIDNKVNLMFRFSKIHYRSGELDYFLGVTQSFFERVHSMGNSFLIFVLGTPDNAVVISTDLFAEWMTGIEPSDKNGVWPLGFYQAMNRETTEFWVQGQGRRDVAMYLNNFDPIHKLL